MSKKYTYEEVMEMTEEEFEKLQRRHWLATEVSNPRIHAVDNEIMSPWFKRELIKKGATGGIVLLSVGAICLTVKYAVDHWND